MTPQPSLMAMLINTKDMKYHMLENFNQIELNIKLAELITISSPPSGSRSIIIFESQYIIE